MAPRSFLLVLSAFLVGIVLAGLHRPFLVLVTLSVGIFLGRSRSVSLTLLLVPFVVGYAYYFTYFTLRAYRAELPLGGENFEAVVISEPNIGLRSQTFPVRLLSPHGGSLVVMADKDEVLSYGDKLRLRGRVERSSSEREYSMVLFPEIDVLGSGEGGRVRQGLLFFKQRLLRTFRTYLSGNEAAFLGGITFGARSALPEDLRADLRASGTTHLIALSGYNVQILISFVFGTFIFALGRRPAYILSITVLVAFVLMVGLEPSVVRAAIMAVIFLTAAELGRARSLLHAVLAAAVIMVLVDPAAIFKVGFQLSFLSLFGVAYLSPRLLDLFYGRTRPLEERQPGKLIEMVCTTIGAQFAVAPVLISQFGEISIAAVPANLMILPFIPMTMAAGFVLSIAGLASEALGYAAALAANVLISYELYVIGWFGDLKGMVGAGVAIVLIILALAILALSLRHYRYAHP